MGEAIDHRFHDLRADGLTAETVARWIDAVGWEKLLNRRGTTWRKLADGDKPDIDQNSAAELMAANPALVKRPVIEIGGRIIVGFKDQERNEVLKLIR